MNAYEFLVLIVAAVVAYWLGANNQTGTSTGVGLKMDKATGIEFPEKKNFHVAKPALSLLGVGTRKKTILNIYSLGFFVSASLTKKLDKEAPEGVAICNTIREATTPKAVQLTFAMGIGPEKIAEAISQLDNVDELVRKKFHAMLIDGMGDGKMKKGESMTFEWKGADTIMATARGSYIGEVKDKALAAGVLELYLGSKSVSPSLLENLGCR
jgi:hypothetical protein